MKKSSTPDDGFKNNPKKLFRKLLRRSKTLVKNCRTKFRIDSKKSVEEPYQLLQEIRDGVGEIQCGAGIRGASTSRLTAARRPPPNPLLRHRESSRNGAGVVVGVAATAAPDTA